MPTFGESPKSHIWHVHVCVCECAERKAQGFNTPRSQMAPNIHAWMSVTIPEIGLCGYSTLQDLSLDFRGGSTFKKGLFFSFNFFAWSLIHANKLPVVG